MREPRFLIGLKNLSGTAKNIEWSFKWENAEGKEQSEKNFPIKALERGQGITLFSVSKIDDEENSYKIYKGRIEIKYQDSFGRNFPQNFDCRIYNYMSPDVAADNMRWIEAMRSKEEIYNKEF
jgi:hypothetical protein